MGKAFADRWGVPVRAAGADAVALLDTAIEDLAALAGDPVALRAARHWVEGNWEATTRSLERALLRHPRDLLALKVAQDLYFFLGNRLELRGTAARVLPAWPRSRPGWGYVQGIYAFGLEENADYRQAESRARAALEHNPRDVWSVHALAPRGAGMVTGLNPAPCGGTVHRPGTTRPTTRPWARRGAGRCIVSADGPGCQDRAARTSGTRSVYPSAGCSPAGRRPAARSGSR